MELECHESEGQVQNYGQREAKLFGCSSVVVVASGGKRHHVAFLVDWVLGGQIVVTRHNDYGSCPWAD